MTEATWLSSAGPLRLLRFLTGKVSERKLRLFSFACVHRFDGLLAHPRMARTRQAVAVFERHVDGLASRGEQQAAASAALEEIRVNVLEHALDNWAGSDMAHALLANDAVVSATKHVNFSIDFESDGVADDLPGDASSDRAGRRAAPRIRALLCDWLRDIAGNPFRPVTVEAAWRTAAVLGTAAHVYESRDFATLPVLADALEEAGCGEAAVLRHCRQPGVHVRGCWVVDQVLGKG